MYLLALHLDSAGCAIGASGFFIARPVTLDVCDGLCSAAFASRARRRRQKSIFEMLRAPRDITTACAWNAALSACASSLGCYGAAGVLAALCKYNDREVAARGITHRTWRLKERRG